MKKYFEKIQDFIKWEEKDLSTKKTIVFFGFYFVFFTFLFLFLFFNGDKNYLKQEYEKGTESVNKGFLGTNYVYDYKVTHNDQFYDYYGKRNGDVESFKYNNLDYYHEKNQFFVNQETWIKTDNPYLFYEFLDLDSLRTVIDGATLMSKDEDEKNNRIYHYLISSNSLNQILYFENTDYDEEADSIDVSTNSSDQITSIRCRLNHFCSHRENCGGTLLIEMNFEMFGNVQKIDNPLS